MSDIDVLVEISRIARLVAGNLLYRRLISNMAVVMLFTVITGMLAGTLLLGGCYVAYLALLRHGFEMDAAALIVGGIVAVATVLSAILTHRFIRRLRNTLLPFSATSRVRRIASAFVDGFTESGNKEEHS